MHNQDKPLAQRWQENVGRLLFGPAPLFIMATLAVRSEHYRFGYVCENSGVTKAVLARHVRTLRLAGYIETRRGTYNELWIRTTSIGQRRFELHVKAMHETITSAREIGKAARS